MRFQGRKGLKLLFPIQNFFSFSHLSGQKAIHLFVIKFTMSAGLYLYRILPEESKALFRLSDYPNLFIGTSIDTYKIALVNLWKQNAGICFILWKLLHIFLQNQRLPPLKRLNP